MIDNIIKHFEKLGLNIVKKTKRSFTIYIKIRDFFDYDSSLSKEELKTIPSIYTINPNAKKQRKRKVDKSKKDNIICYPFMQLEFGQTGCISMLAEPKEIFSHILNKDITALFDASSISHRLEYIFDFLNGNYSTPILQGTIQKQTLKELKEFYKNPNTDEPIDLSNKTANDIFKNCPEAKEDYLNYEFPIVIEMPGLDPKTVGRNNRFKNSGESFNTWEAFRSTETEVINYISDFSFQTNVTENDKNVHELFTTANIIDKEDKGLILTDEVDKDASFFENGCYLYYQALSAVNKLPVSEWNHLKEKEVIDKIQNIETVNPKMSSWIKRMCDNGVHFFNNVKKLPKDFRSFQMMIYIIHEIERIFDGQFKIIDNDWSKFCKRIDDIHNTLSNSSGFLYEKTWKSSAGDDQTFPISKYRAKNHLLHFGVRLVLDRLFDTTKDDYGLNELGIRVKSLKSLSAENKRIIITAQTKDEKVFCDISNRPYSLNELEFCHIEGNSFGVLNEKQVNEPKNIRLAHRRYNRMMGTLNYHSFKEIYKTNFKRIDEQLNLI